MYNTQVGHHTHLAVCTCGVCLPRNIMLCLNTLPDAGMFDLPIECYQVRLAMMRAHMLSVLLKL